MDRGCVEHIITNMCSSQFKIMFLVTNPSFRLVDKKQLNLVIAIIIRMKVHGPISVTRILKLLWKEIFKLN